MPTAAGRTRSPQPLRGSHTKALPAPPETIAVWFKVTAKARPLRLQDLLAALAGPEFTVETCRESARLLPDRAEMYSAHWCCRFSRAPNDELADLRLLNRLTRAGFHILRFDSQGGD